MTEFQKKNRKRRACLRISSNMIGLTKDGWSGWEEAASLGFFPPAKDCWLRPAPSASDKLAHESKYHYLIRPTGACHTHFLDCNKCHFSAIETSDCRSEGTEGWGVEESGGSMMHEGLFILKREAVRVNYSPKKMRFTYGPKRAKSTRGLHGGRR